MRFLFGMVALAGMLGSCSPAPYESVEKSEGGTAADIATPSIPPEVLGSWRLVRQECDDDIEDAVPDQNLSDVTMWLDETGTYTMNIAGWQSVGQFSVSESPTGTRVTHEDTQLNFDTVDGTLQNWSEGDAVYLCGNVFEREG